MILRTCREFWTIEIDGKRQSREPVTSARLDDDVKLVIDHFSSIRNFNCSYKTLWIVFQGKWINK